MSYYVWIYIAIAKWNGETSLSWQGTESKIQYWSKHLPNTCKSCLWSGDRQQYQTQNTYAHNLTTKLRTIWLLKEAWHECNKFIVLSTDIQIAVLLIIAEALEVRARGPSQYKDVVLPEYGFPFKDKTVSPTVLSLTCESPYLGKTVFILRRGPALCVAPSGHVIGFHMQQTGQTYYWAVVIRVWRRLHAANHGQQRATGITGNAAQTQQSSFTTLFSLAVSSLNNAY